MNPMPQTHAHEKRGGGIKRSVMILALIIIAIAAAYADWWAFSQKFPNASFWAWVIAPR